MAEPASAPKPFGLPLRAGRDNFKRSDWELILDFIKSRMWLHSEPALESDKVDPLLSTLPPYGALLMGFDFHLCSDGPKLIEVNTNAGGLASVFTFPKLAAAQEYVRHELVAAMKKEYSLAFPGLTLRRVAIVDDHVTSQGLYPEMLCFADLLKNQNIDCVVVCPEELKLLPEGMFYGDLCIDMIYNRMTDFRLESPEHAHVRKAVVEGHIAITPHPAVYVRSADKRLLTRLTHAVVPSTYILKDKAIEEWQQIKKDFVFKPPVGNASKGVYRGDKLSVAKLKTLPPDTVVQRFVPPPQAADESKYDLRVFTRDTDVIGIASRHFTGQVMEMSSAKAGFQEALPEGVCCLPCLDPLKCADLLKKWMASELPKGATSTPEVTQLTKPEIQPKDSLSSSLGTAHSSSSCAGCKESCECCTKHT